MRKDRKGIMRNLQLKNLRKQAGYGTQADLARVLGANPRTYASWEREEVGLSLYEAGRIADARQNEMNVLFAQLDETRKAFLLEATRGLAAAAHRRAD